MQGQPHLIELGRIQWGSHYRQFSVKANSDGYLMVGSQAHGPMSRNQNQMNKQFPDLKAVEAYCFEQVHADIPSFILEIVDERGERETVQFGIVWEG